MSSPVAIPSRGLGRQARSGEGGSGPEARLRSLAALAWRGDPRAYRELLLELSLYFRGYYAARSAAAPFEWETMVQDAPRLVHAKRGTCDSRRFADWAHAIARHVLFAHAGATVADRRETPSTLFASALPEPTWPLMRA